MRSRLRDLLRCPACRGTFQVEPIDTTVTHGEQDIEQGWLTCGCGATYPIVRGIPRILDDAPRLFADFYARHPRAKKTSSPATGATSDAINRTRESFGYQWTHFHEMATDFKENFLEYIHPVDEAFFRGKLGIDIGCGFGRHIYNAA